MLLDSLSSAAIYVSSRNSFEMLEALGDGQYDYLICEMSEAQLMRAVQKRRAGLYFRRAGFAERGRFVAG